MTWLYVDSVANRKEKQFLEGSLVKLGLNNISGCPELAPSSHLWKKGVCELLLLICTETVKVA